MFTTNWHWIEVCQNVVLSKIDINKQKIESRILRNLDLQLKIRQQELEVWCLANNLLAYIIYQNIQSHKKKTYAHFIRQELEHRILYRWYTEQFKLHFTDMHKSKIEY